MNLQLDHAVSVCACGYMVNAYCWFWNIPAHHNGPEDMPQSSHTGQTHPALNVTWKGGRERHMIVFTFSDRRHKAIHHFRRAQRAEAGSEALWWLRLFLPTRLVCHRHLLIRKMNECRFITSVAFVPYSILLPLGSPLCLLKQPQIYISDMKLEITPLNCMCVWFSLCSPLSDSLTSVSLTAGTGRPFSSCKLWYPGRRVG